MVRTLEIENRGLYAERNAFFKRMEDRDPEALSLWKRFRDISIERYISTYARLNITFDEYSGESTVRPETIEKVENMLKDRGVYEENEGSWVINFEKHGARKLGTAVVRNRGRTTTYLLRDVAAVLERVEKYEFDKMIYVVSAEQDSYFQRVFKTVEIMGDPNIAAKLVHINFGKAQGMSSRLGTVKLLSDILDECGSAMHEVMRSNEAKYAQVADPEAVADVVGITAIMAQDMSGKRVNNYPFDITRMTSFEGDTGPYLQYSHARLCSIMRKANLAADQVAKADFSLLKEPHAIDILRLMAQYPDMTTQAFKTLEPTTILTYLFRLTHQVSSAYDVIKVLGTDEGPEVMLARSALHEGARQVLENAMRLLGFTPVASRCGGVSPQIHATTTTWHVKIYNPERPALKSSFYSIQHSSFRLYKRFILAFMFLHIQRPALTNVLED
ncbi:arginyl-tRNA synthetase [Histoplasma capsulatum H143]|uniref:arginine--tRNA ligase n=1 Tax=Ajellomyces capsulatus (strain H143) TaxID=544712 RepID=C6HK29_AJECH|nr:arginyl-tRNA synthetase [Histoplasma capsulatum H143]